MKLHLDRDTFDVFIERIHERFLYRSDVLEKDYYVVRNQEMIKDSDICVFYYNENYLPPKRKSRRNITDTQPKSGTAMAYNFAVRKKKEIINIFE